jgi:tetratricopeptide (TPR) repeat protein
MTSRGGRAHGRRRTPAPAGDRPLVSRSAADASVRPLDAAAMAVAVLLTASLAARALATAVSSATLWGLDVPAHLAPAWAWIPWGLAALALWPAVGVRAGAGLRRAAPDARFGIVLGLALVALVLLLPDRTRFVGDASLRFGNLFADESPTRLFPQATPLDVALHFHLPRMLGRIGHVPPAVVPALLGALWAAGLAGVAVYGARALGARGAAVVAVAAALAFGGGLALCTGYLKAFLGLSVLTTLAGVAALRVARQGRGLAALGVAVAGALALHRSGLALTPLWLATLAVAVGARRALVPWRAPATWTGMVLPAMVLALMAGRFAAVLAGFDLAHHVTTPAVTRAGGPLAAAFAGRHLLDAANVLLFLAPAAPLMLAVPFVARRSARTELVLLAALVAPWLAVVLLVHPQQGIYRDWDVFAPAGAACAVAAAWAIARALDDPRAAAWLGPAAALAVAAPVLQLLVLQADPARALVRIESRLEQEPGIPADERAATWDFIGMRELGLGRDADAERALRKAVEAAPNPRLIVEWGVALLSLRDYPRALDAFRRAARLDPDLIGAWRGLATAASALGDHDELARAANGIERLAPGDPMVIEARRALAGAPPQQ